MSRTSLRLSIVAFAVILTMTVLGVLVHFRLASTTSTGKLRVTATFYPMAEFARQVGGSEVSVTTLVKPGVEPHDYDPTPKDIATIYTSKVFIYNGGGLERWVGNVQSELAHNRVVAVQASQGLPLQAKDPADTAHQPSTDPHVWMDPVFAESEVRAIEAGLIQADPANRPIYQTNAAKYLAQLQSLDQAFRNGLQHCQLRTIITSHQAFNYLARRYGLSAVGIAGLSPDDEPSPATLASVASLAKQYRIKYIFFESLASPKLSQTIARETGARTLVFNPLEGLTSEETQRGDSYISVQLTNLRALQTALECQQ